MDVYARRWFHGPGFERFTSAVGSLLVVDQALDKAKQLAPDKLAKLHAARK